MTPTDAGYGESVTVPLVRFRLPDDTLREAGPDALLGRSPLAAVRVDDPRVATVHAELSWRAAGFVLLARGGPLFVGGRPVAEATLSLGMEIALAPGQVLRVEQIVDGRAPVVPPTAGRERLVFRVRERVVEVGAPDGPPVEVAGRSAAILTALLAADGPVTWERLAEAAWPEDGALRSATTRGDLTGGSAWTPVDERRFRNRWDHQLAALRRQLEPFRCGGLLRMLHGMVELRAQPSDVIDER